MKRWKSTTNSAHKEQAPSVEYTALDDSGAVAAAAGAPESLKSASDDEEVKKAQQKKAQQKEKKRMSDQKRRKEKKREKSLAQQATDKAFSDLTVALPVPAPAAARSQPASDLEAFKQAQWVEFDRLQAAIAGLLQNYQCTMLKNVASMRAQPRTSAVGGAAVGTKNKRESQEDADTTGPGQSKKPRAAKRPAPRKESSVTPASPGPLPQLPSQPTPEAQTEPHGKTCELPHCDNKVQGDAEFCEDCLTHPCINGPHCCDECAVPGKERCQNCEDAQSYCQTVNCPNEVGLEQTFCTMCMEDTRVGSGSSADSSGKNDETESEDSAHED